MRITIEIDSELWRVRHWWNRTLCRWFGHPRFEEPPTPMFWSISIFHDGRPRCVRCHMPEPGSKPTVRRFEFKEGA